MAEALFLLVGFTLGFIASVIPDYLKRELYVRQLTKLEGKNDDQVDHWSLKPLPEDPEDMSDEEQKAAEELGYFGT